MSPSTPREIAERIGRIGVWSFALDENDAASGREFAAEVEALGYRALWIPESIGGKEIFSHAATLLSATSTITVASGIANIWARDPMAMNSGALTLNDAHRGRFLLGLGVSHADSVEVRGQEYRTPYARMAGYLDAMDRAEYLAPVKDRPPPRLLAALGPKMLRLSAERASGAHTYFVPVEHTKLARATLGSDPVLAVELTAVLDANPESARTVARKFAVDYLGLPNYANNLRRLGFGEADVAGAGSDSLIDATIAWGDARAIADRVGEHLDAGADHVAVQLISSSSDDFCLDGLRELASPLLKP